ncbi:putative ABC transporter permease [Clostridium sardiniense]
MREIVIYFTIYSFLGWVAETIYCFIIDKKFTYRGFLYGPVCPIYGFGGVIVIKFLHGIGNNPIKVFLGGMILASVLEYITSYVLEKLFHMKWWDYSTYKFNINGRVCLKNSIFFGLLALFIVEILEPMLRDSVSSIPSSIIYPVSTIIIIIFIIDLTFTVAHLIHLKEHLDRLKNIKGDLKDLNIEFKQFTEAEFEKIKMEIATRKNNGQNIDMLNKVMIKLDSLKNEAKQNRRVLKAFPHAKYNKEHTHFKELKNLIDNK